MSHPSFYAEGGERRHKVHQLFSRIAHRYDLVNDLQSAGFHRWWKRQLKKLARVAPGEKVLDVGCGTGDLTWSFAAAGSHTLGLDFTRAMLDQARQRRTDLRPGNGSIAFIQADACQLPLPPNTFDVVTAGYLLRNLPSWEDGLQEMHRVLKPGGRLLVLEFGKPVNPLWRRLYFAYLRLVVPIFGVLFFGDSATYAYILESLDHYPEAGRISDHLERLGFSGIAVKGFFGGAMTLHHASKPQAAPVPASAAASQSAKPNERSGMESAGWKPNCRQTFPLSFHFA